MAPLTHLLDKIQVGQLAHCITRRLMSDLVAASDSSHVKDRSFDQLAC